MNKKDVRHIGIILLAAGSSTRMGRSKQLLEIDGQPLLRRAVKVALDANVSNVVVVLGSNFEAHQKVITDLPVKIFHNQNWENGIGSSIKAGLAFLLNEYPETEAVVISVCDQPMLSSEHIVKLVNGFQTSASHIIATAYAGTEGVPAIFDKSIFPSLLNLPEDQGAKIIIQKYKDSLQSVTYPDGAIDLDTPHDYKKFIGQR